MRYVLFAILLLGLVACESDNEKQAREQRERQSWRSPKPLTPEAQRMLWEMQQMQRQQQFQQAPQPQQAQVVCPQCRGSGRASRDPQAEAFTDNTCEYCGGRGMIWAGGGQRGRWTR